MQTSALSTLGAYGLGRILCPVRRTAPRMRRMGNRCSSTMMIHALKSVAKSVWKDGFQTVGYSWFLASNGIWPQRSVCSVDGFQRVVAQLVAQRSPKPQVAGSSPVCPAHGRKGFTAQIKRAGSPTRPGEYFAQCTVRNAGGAGIPTNDE